MYASVDIRWLYAYVYIVHVRTTRELGGVIKGRRTALGWTQEALASRAGVARQWIIAVEKGKPTAEVASILRTITALGLVADVVEAPRSHRGVDLDQLLGGGDG
jgi:y4mF family transcriptional regulator